MRYSRAEWLSAGFAAQSVAEAKLGRGEELARGLSPGSGEAERLHPKARPLGLSPCRITEWVEAASGEAE